MESMALNTGKLKAVLLFCLCLQISATNNAWCQATSKTALPDGALPPRLNPQDIEAQKILQDVAKETTDSTGSLFVDPEHIFVKPPLLTALITIDQRYSPYALDASGDTPIALDDALKIALSNNLDIKISQTDVEQRRWLYFGSLGGFLPNFSNDIAFQGLKGNYVSPAGLVIPISNPYFTANSAFQYYLYKGGSILYTALKTKHDYKASQFASKATIYDTLLETSKLYYDLVLNDVLLQIKMKTVDVAKASVIVNQDQFDNGANTQLDVLQAKYELSKDRQDLIAQQVKRRESAVKLARSLNIDSGVDLTLRDRHIIKKRLVDRNMQPGDLIQLAVTNRPELKRYDQLRLAAIDEIKIARASLLPTFAATGAVIGSGSNAQTLSSNSQSQQTQQTPLSSSGTGIGSVSSAGSLALGAPPSGTTGPRHFTTRSLFNIGFDFQWNIGGMALTEVAQVQSAKAHARRVKLEFNRELNRIYQEVRDSFLSSMSAEKLIEETTDAVTYAKEGLRVCQIRVQEGVGTTLDLVIAQRNYTAALTSKANAIIDFNLSQIKLLHSVGRLSMDNVMSRAPIKD